MKTLLISALLLLSAAGTVLAQKLQTLYYPNGMKAVEGRWTTAIGSREDVPRMMALSDNRNPYTPASESIDPLAVFKGKDSYHTQLLFEGPVTIWHGDGTVREKKTYTHGILNGPYEYHFPNGKLASKGIFRQGMQDGKWTYYYADGGILSTASYKAYSQRELDSLLQQRVFTGKVTDGHIKDGGERQLEAAVENVFRRYSARISPRARPDGAITFYRKGGRPEAVLSYRRGTQEGEWTAFDEKGMKSLRALYKDGRLTAVFDADGKERIADRSAALNDNFGMREVEGVGTGPIEPMEQPLIFKYVEQMPAFGGDVNEFINANLKYPPEAMAARREGRVIVQFVVTETGSVKNAEVVRSSGDSYLDKEAIRIIGLMPPWNPGKQNGHRVNVYYTLPVTFKLQ